MGERIPPALIYKNLFIMANVFSAMLPVVGAIGGGSLAGPVGAVIGSSLGSGISSQFDIHQSRDWQETLMKMQHDYNVQDWQMMNEYNSPKNQIKRLEEAGLNPLLADITGGLSPSTASAVQIPQSELSAMAALQSANIQSQLLESQIRNLDADTRGKEADADIKSNDAEWRDRMNGATYKGKLTDIDFTFTKEMESDANRAYLWKLCTQIDHANQKIDSDIALNEQTIKNMQTERGYTAERAKQVFLDNLMKTETWETQKQLLVAQLHMTEAQATSFLSQAALCNSQSEMVNLANEFARETMDARVYQEKRKGALLNKQIEYTSNMSQLSYWNHNNARFAYNFNVEHKEDMFITQMFGTLMTAGAAMVGAGALIGDKTVSSTSTVQNVANPVRVTGFGNQ